MIIAHGKRFGNGFWCWFVLMFSAMAMAVICGSIRSFIQIPAVADSMAGPANETQTIETLKISTNYNDIKCVSYNYYYSYY